MFAYYSKRNQPLPSPFVINPLCELLLNFSDHIPELFANAVHAARRSEASVIGSATLAQGVRNGKPASNSKIPSNFFSTGSVFLLN